MQSAGHDKVIDNDMNGADGLVVLVYGRIYAFVYHCLVQSKPPRLLHTFLSLVDRLDECPDAVLCLTYKKLILFGLYLRSSVLKVYHNELKDV